MVPWTVLFYIDTNYTIIIMITIIIIIIIIILKKTLVIIIIIITFNHIELLQCYAFFIHSFID